MENENKSNMSPLMRLLLIVVVFIGLVIAVKFVFAVLWTVIKWIIIGGLALIAAVFIVRKLGGGDKDSS